MDSPLRQTLLKYGPPIDITNEPEISTNKNFTSISQKNIQLPQGQNPNIEEYLNAIFPPRQWNENGRKYIQYVSTEQVHRGNVRELHRELDQLVAERQAKTTEICPVRREIYSQFFDEVIRQVTLECLERGLLFVRVRDEIKMTIAAYKTLYDISITFGIRKQLQAEEGKVEMETKEEELRKKKILLENRKNELLNRKEALIRKYQEKKAAEEAKKKAELEFLTNQGVNLEKFLKGLESKSA